MKKVLVALLLLIWLLCPVNAVQAAQSLVKKEQKTTFLSSFWAALSNFFSSATRSLSESSASSRKEEFSGSRLKLLELLNKNELYIRVTVSGEDMYLKRELILEKIDDAEEKIKESQFNAAYQEKLLERISGIRKLLNTDLVQSPQDKIKPYVLDSFDDMEALIFSIEDKDADKILEIFESLHLSS